MKNNTFKSAGIKLLALLLTFTFAFTKAKAQDADMLEKAIGAVVTVAVYKTDDNKQALGFRDKKTNAQKAYEKLLDLEGSQISGSGFVIEKNGKKYVITNAHVVENAADLAQALYVFSIDRTKYEVKIVGGDTYFDFAVLEFVTPPGKEISTIKFTTKSPRLGEKVYAIGNPLGEYPYTVTDGIISAKNRVRNGITGKFGFLQSTATVIWGNSGGPLVNTKGEVVGINSQIAFAPRGGDPLWQPQINFALEHEICERLLNDVVTNNGLIRRAYVGFEVTQTYDYMEFMTWFGGSPWVLRDTLPVIKNVIPGSPAASVLANKIGSTIVSVNGVLVRSNNEVFGELEKVRPGETVKLTISTTSGTENVEIKTTEITTRSLEQLATYVIESGKKYKIIKNDDGSIAIKNTTEEESLALGTRSGKGAVSKGGVKQIDDFSTSTTYQVISAGVQFTNYSSKYRIKKMSDLGAAFRLTGETGTIQLYVMDENSESWEPMSITFDLSGSETESQNTLWY
ncbi:MAG TPA: trypsin-like peptidase domain-containing protein [Bacteroidia bacterium]|nr:trypsin-like peptidase domain-containing protein [Bacteroidia bacterium]